MATYGKCDGKGNGAKAKETAWLGAVIVYISMPTWRMGSVTDTPEGIHERRPRSSGRVTAPP
eukprot:gene1884-2564_t